MSLRHLLFTSNRLSLRGNFGQLSLLRATWFLTWASLSFRFVAQARGECQYFSNDTITTAGEGCKSNALMRCCKDIGIASELWDPRFIRTFKKAHCAEVWVENVSTKKKRQIWMRKDNQTPSYPFALAKN